MVFGSSGWTLYSVIVFAHLHILQSWVPIAIPSDSHLPHTPRTLFGRSNWLDIWYHCPVQELRRLDIHWSKAQEIFGGEVIRGRQYSNKGNVNNYQPGRANRQVLVAFIGYRNSQVVHKPICRQRTRYFPYYDSDFTGSESFSPSLLAEGGVPDALIPRSCGVKAGTSKVLDE